jgi:hypothetical protein
MRDFPFQRSTEDIHVGGGPVMNFLPENFGLVEVAQRQPIAFLDCGPITLQ